MEKYDPPRNQLKPAPVQVTRRIAYIAQHSKYPITQATTDMIRLSSFLLTRPGDYTSSPSDTVPFTLSDVQLLIGGRRLNLITDTDQELLSKFF